MLHNMDFSGRVIVLMTKVTMQSVVRRRRPFAREHFALS